MNYCIQRSGVEYLMVYLFFVLARNFDKLNELVSRICLQEIALSNMQKYSNT